MATHLGQWLLPPPWTHVKMGRKQAMTAPPPCRFAPQGIWVRTPTASAWTRYNVQRVMGWTCKCVRPMRTAGCFSFSLPFRLERNLGFWRWNSSYSIFTAEGITLYLKWIICHGDYTSLVGDRAGGDCWVSQEEICYMFRGLRRARYIARGTVFQRPVRMIYLAYLTQLPAFWLCFLDYNQPWNSLNRPSSPPLQTMAKHIITIL